MAKASIDARRIAEHMAKDYGFVPRVCSPYQATTKRKGERFNGYLKGSFLVPLATSLMRAGLQLDVTSANAQVGHWLAEVANARIHATTRERPDKRLAEEQAALTGERSAQAAPTRSPDEDGDAPLDEDTGGI